MSKATTEVRTAPNGEKAVALVYEREQDEDGFRQALRRRQKKDGKPTED